MNADIIDFTAEALHRRWIYHSDKGEHSEAATLSHLILCYLEGVMQVEWKDGEPHFCLSEYGQSLADTMVDDETEYVHEPVQLGLFSGASGEEN